MHATTTHWGWRMCVRGRSGVRFAAAIVACLCGARGVGGAPASPASSVSRVDADRSKDEALRALGHGRAAEAVSAFRDALRALGVRVIVAESGLVEYALPAPEESDDDRIAAVLTETELAESAMARGKAPAAQPRPVHMLNAATASIQAVKVLERDRGRVAFDDFERKVFVGSWLRSATDSAVFWMKVLGRAKDPSLLDRAFLYADRSRCRYMLDALAHLEVLSADPELSAWYARATQAALLELSTRSVVALYPEIVPGAGEDAPDAAIMASAEDETNRRIAVARREQAALDAMRATIDRRRPGAIEALALGPAPLPSLSDIQGRLGPREAILEYHVADERGLVHVFVVKPTGNVIAGTSPTPERQVVERAIEFAAVLASPKRLQWKEQAKELYRDLVAPVRAALSDVDRLTIVPHGALHSLPFHALVDPESGKPLVESFEIRYLPAASVLPRLAREAIGTGRPTVVGIDAFSSPDRPVLLHAEAEAREVASLLGAGSELRLGSTGRARKHEVLAALPAARSVHIASHGRYDVLDPSRSYVVLQGADGADEELQGWEILSHRCAARLVMLSACETYVRPTSKRAFSDDVIALPQAFLLAGARTVVATLWTVDDAKSRALVRGFYASMAAPSSMSPAPALRAATRSVLRADPGAHPHDWAPFVVIGER
jgi:CHAT domain-containing protein